MKQAADKPVRVFLFLLLTAAAMVVSLAAAPALAAPPLYWCPDRTQDQQYSATPSPGCTPLVEKREKKEPDKKEAKAKPHRVLKIENIESEVTGFLRQYREFLACCRTDLNALDEIDELGNDVADLLQLAQASLFSEQMKLRGFILSQWIPPVAQARGQLRALRKELEKIGDSMDKLEELDYEAAGRARRDIQEQEATVEKGFQPTLPPQSAPTGKDIGYDPASSRPGGPIRNNTVGMPKTTLPTNRLGPDEVTNAVLPNSTLPSRIGAGPATDSAGAPISTLPARVPTQEGGDPTAGVPNTTLQNRIGHEQVPDATLPNSTLRNNTGFELGTPQAPVPGSTLPHRAGPNIGDSNLNSGR